MLKNNLKLIHYVLIMSLINFLFFHYPFFKYASNTVLCESGREVSRSRLQSYVGEITEEDFFGILKVNEYVYKEYIFKEKC